METKMIDELEEKAQRAESDFKEKLHSLEGHVAQKVGEVAETAEEVATDVKDFVQALNPVEQTKRYPIAGVSAAAVLGGYVGFKLGGPVKRLVHEEATKIQAQRPARTGPSFFEEAALVLLGSPLVAAAADWGRKKFPDYTWAIDAAQKMSNQFAGSGATFTTARHSESSAAADGVKPDSENTHDELPKDILH